MQDEHILLREMVLAKPCPTTRMPALSVHPERQVSSTMAKSLERTGVTVINSSCLGPHLTLLCIKDH